jgi:hypothetical protein
VLQYILKIEGGDGAARATIKQRARVTGAIAARVRKRRPLVIGLATKSRLQCGLAAVGLAVGHLVPMCRLRPPSWHTARPYVKIAGTASYWARGLEPHQHMQAPVVEASPLLSQGPSTDRALRHRAAVWTGVNRRYFQSARRAVMVAISRTRSPMCINKLMSSSAIRPCRAISSRGLRHFTNLLRTLA